MRKEKWVYCGIVMIAIVSMIGWSSAVHRITKKQTLLDDWNKYAVGIKETCQMWQAPDAKMARIYYWKTDECAKVLAEEAGGYQWYLPPKCALVENSPEFSAWKCEENPAKDDWRFYPLHYCMVVDIQSGRLVLWCDPQKGGIPKQLTDFTVTQYFR